jgi:hypothetical protein
MNSSLNSHKLHMNAIYQHYKGKLYKVLYVARHSESHEELVIYQALYGDMQIWARPLSMFCDNVIIEGKNKARFEQVVV